MKIEGLCSSGGGKITFQTSDQQIVVVPPTGKICGSLLKAIDEFCMNKSYDFDFEQTKCPCGKCKGYGNGRNNFVINKKTYDGKEYPGMHRSLLFALKGLIFYLKKDKSVYSVRCIESGYRCWENNKQKGRKSTNHMGCALDLHFNLNGSRTINVKDMENIRSNFFCKYMNAPRNSKSQIYGFGWIPDHIGMEAKLTNKKKPGATTWIHFDVREFSLKYLDKKIFASTTEEINGESILQLAKLSGKTETCRCLSEIWHTNQPAHTNVIKKEYDMLDAKNALNHICNKYGKHIAALVEKIYRWETSHFTSMQYRKCETCGMEIHGNAPYYGWDKTFFQNNLEYRPIGTWSAYEGVGLSERGGNKQVTDKKKSFVIMSSVKAGMEYLVYYIQKHNNNYARWYSTDEQKQEIYRKSIQSINPRIVNNIK